jgi:trehalose 6-phosphate synthase/phosphatase
MNSSKKNRLILISNRLPFQLQENGGKVLLRQSDGGLVTALKGYFESSNGALDFTEKIWLGSADFSEKRWKRYTDQRSGDNNFHVKPIFIESKVYNPYYNGFCNATLWPLFHYFPSFVVYNQTYFEMYEKVNALFAAALKSIYEPGDTVWIHDYQLFLLPGMLREMIPDARIGFFLHIPFPSYEIFRLLHRSWKEKIIRGILGADLIGFHTHEYVQHFLKTVRMVIGVDHDFRVITYMNRLIKAEMFPLGIDYDKFNGTSQLPAVIDKKNTILNNFPDKKIIFSVDRLDYTKGVTHRLSGFERFLELYPEWKNNIVFILVVVPSRQIISKYNERRKLIEEQVGSINGRFSTLSWQPIIYRYSNLEFEELCALYLAADVALITPLRDGMNLVAKEYVASCADQKGALILSELAGAAAELGESIQVNPLDKGELALALQQALMMPEEEQRSRLSLMQDRLRSYDVVNWVRDYLEQLQDVKRQQTEEGNKFLTLEGRADIIEAFHQAKSRNLLLDYDGTLVPFARYPRQAVPDKNLIRLLTTLSTDPNTTLTIISGRDPATLGEWFSSLSVNLIAEHGAAIKRQPYNWMHETLDQTWKAMIRPTLDLFVVRCPGSFVEEKNHTLAWHYRNVDDDLGFIRSRELLDNLFHLIRNGQLQVIDGNKVIEIRVAGIDKGAAARKLVEETAAEFVLAIGDDKTDEDMFKALADKAITIKVGTGHSNAKFCLASQQEVIRLLQDLATQTN